MCNPFLFGSSNRGCDEPAVCACCVDSRAFGSRTAVGVGGVSSGGLDALPRSARHGEAPEPHGLWFMKGVLTLCQAGGTWSRAQRTRWSRRWLLRGGGHDPASCHFIFRIFTVSISCLYHVVPRNLLSSMSCSPLMLLISQIFPAIFGMVISPVAWFMNMIGGRRRRSQP